MCKLNKFKLLSSIFGLLVSTIAGFGQVNFTSSNLPIVVINTNGQTIPDEPKITVNMGIIWNENGQRNFLSDPFNHYDGLIGIEIRGSSSQMFPKKQYGFETRDADGEDLDVELLGMPEESDWILHAPYSDKSLMRNVLAYDFANRMGRYASRTHYCELVLNGEYMGVYILMEKIKRDDNRVNIKKLDEDEISGVDLTGGYIIKIDKPDVPGTGGWYSPFRPYENAPQMINYLYETPDAEDIVP
ncbi:MAG: CotH kinase family protein, partial [Calditrichaeota bacterium]|nr:CotH kinase family protein [Calditrichota bacterium]